MNMKLENELYYSGDFSKKNLILFIPGTLLSPCIYKNVSIPKGYEPIFLSWHNAPGNHTVSGVADKIISLIKAHNCQHIILAGHSSGGFIALQIYFQLSDKNVVKGLVLCDTGCNTQGHANQKSREDLIAEWNEAALDNFISKCFTAPIDDLTKRELKAYGLQITAEMRVEPLMSQRDIDFTPIIKNISCPTMVVFGILDKVRKLEHSQQLVDGIPHAKLCILPAAGHTPMYEDAEGYSSALMQLCAEIENNC